MVEVIGLSILNVKCTPVSSNGRTTDSDSVNESSNLSTGSKLLHGSCSLKIEKD